VHTALKAAPDKVSWAHWLLTTIGITAVVVIAASYLTIVDDGRVPAAVDAAPPPAPAVTEEPVAAVVEPGPVVDTPEPQASLREQLQLAESLTSPDSAMETLFSLWQLDFERGAGDGCAQAAAAGYRCIVQRGSLTSLRQYDRPAILTLVDQGGANHHVVLTALDDTQAAVSLGGVIVSHPVGEILALWFGDYTLLWHPPAGVPASLGPGSIGPGVLWLRESLAAVDARYRSTSMTSDVFDQDLQQAVRLFQRDQRLMVDGVAGRQTQLIINSLLGSSGAPRLLTVQVAQE
jgi:general secretion pathway protein A